MQPIIENQGFQAKVVEHSSTQYGPELITMQLRYPRFVHSEFMTHRVFSRNASSSRAIPVQKLIDQVRNDPAMPVHWGKNQPGMQARAELPEVEQAGHIQVHPRAMARNLWCEAANEAANIAQEMLDIGLHKQVSNRILEPFQWMHVIVTATDWDNFFELRDHEDADPNIALLARLMWAAIQASKPVLRDPTDITAAAWHLPYITAIEREEYSRAPVLLAKASSARCARVSFLNHDGTSPVFAKDLELHQRLVGSRPLHASPVEHQAYPFPKEMAQERSGNFSGWKQFRKLVEYGCC